MKRHKYIILLRNPVNRSQKRQAEREYNDIVEFMSDHFIAWYRSLFDESNGLSYQHLYNCYLILWNNACELFELKKYQFITIDEHYFERKFKPLEKEKAA